MLSAFLRNIGRLMSSEKGAAVRAHLGEILTARPERVLRAFAVAKADSIKISIKFGDRVQTLNLGAGDFAVLMLGGELDKLQPGVYDPDIAPTKVDAKEHIDGQEGL